MPNTITNRQMVMILILTLTSYTVVEIPKVMAQCAGTGSWATILLASLPFGLAAYMLVTLNNMFQGKMLFDYSGELVGKVGAYFLAAYIAQYFLTVLVNLNLSMASLLKANFLPNTPVWATTLAALPVLGFVAYKGVTNVARLVEIYGVIFLLIAIIVHIVMLMQGDWYHILPLYVPEDTGRYLSALKESIYPFLGIETLLVIPFTAKNGKKAAGTAFLTVLFVGLFYVLVVESSIMMLNVNEIVHYNYPLIVAIRQIQLPSIKIFQRLDLLYLTVGFIGLFAGLSVVYLNVVEYVCRMIPKAGRAVVVVGVGLAAFIMELVLKDVKDVIKILTNVITYTGIAVLFVIPATLLIIAKVRKHGKNRAA